MIEKRKRKEVTDHHGDSVGGLLKLCVKCSELAMECVEVSGRVNAAFGRDGCRDGGVEGDDDFGREPLTSAA